MFICLSVVGNIEVVILPCVMFKCGVLFEAVNVCFSCNDLKQSIRLTTVFVLLKVPVIILCFEFGSMICSCEIIHAVLCGKDTCVMCGLNISFCLQMCISM
jgi:hypothetical protein